MFQAGEPQESLWQSEFLITPRKAKLMRRSWAQVFRNEALVLIEEERFAPMYSPDMGRPNRAVQTVLGVLVLKEMLDLTDMEALEELEFNLLWHHALRLEMEEAHLAQKTLHNFRVRLMEHDGGRLAFCETTDRMIEALGLRTGKQRLDSTHVMSNIAVLTRLGLFCETVRVFLLAVSREHPGLCEGIGDGLAQRYLKETGEASRYEDARSGEGRRRLSVCARDMCRLVDRFRGTAVAKMEEYGLLERLLHEQCHVGRHRDGRPSADDDDAAERTQGEGVHGEAPERVEMHFAREVCDPCSLRSRCPVRWRRRPELGGEWSPSGAYVLSADLARVNIGRRRRAESDGQWRRRYGLLAGIEGTNSELGAMALAAYGYVEVRGSGSPSTSSPGV